MMDCRTGCGACCIAPSIHAPFYGMPEGKAAGVSCVHLDDARACALFGDERRPALCDAFAPEESLCGASRAEALANIQRLEVISAPGVQA